MNKINPLRILLLIFFFAFTFSSAGFVLYLDLSIIPSLLLVSSFWLIASGILVYFHGVLE